MEYMRLIFELFYDFMEKGFEPAGVNYNRFNEFLDKKVINREDNEMLWEMATMATSESAFHGFLAGFNVARILFTGIGELAFPKPDDFESMMLQNQKEKSDGK